jgi:hypothetical protein
VSTITWLTAFSNDDKNFENSNFESSAQTAIISGGWARRTPRPSCPPDSAYWFGYGRPARTW